MNKQCHALPFQCCELCKLWRSKQQLLFQEELSCFLWTHPLKEIISTVLYVQLNKFNRCVGNLQLHFWPQLHLGLQEACSPQNTCRIPCHSVVSNSLEWANQTTLSETKCQVHTWAPWKHTLKWRANHVARIIVMYLPAHCYKLFSIVMNSFSPFFQHWSWE